MINRLKKKFGVNIPITLNEILDEMNEYSRSRVLQLLKKAQQDQTIIKYIKGIYYIPTKTSYGKSLIRPEEVVIKKYLRNKDNIIGIYSGLQLQQNFLLTTQIPNTIEVITNNETMCKREIKIANRKVILRKSRLPINNENVAAYTLLELFNMMGIEKFKSDYSVQRKISNFIKDNYIKKTDVIKIIEYFPAKTSKKIIESGISNELA